MDDDDDPESELEDAVLGADDVTSVWRWAVDVALDLAAAEPVEDGVVPDPAELVVTALVVTAAFAVLL